MHIILGFLGTIVTILWLLHRLAEMGIDLGGLNPWLWRRRRNWKNRYEANPIYVIESPMEATAVLITAVAKADGVISSEEKQEVLNIFESEFSLSKREAAELLISSDFLLGDGDAVRSNMEGVLQPSLESFSEEQAASAVQLIRRMAAVGGNSSPIQNEIVAAASRVLTPKTQPKGKWD